MPELLAIRKADANSGPLRKAASTYTCFRMESMDPDTHLCAQCVVNEKATSYGVIGSHNTPKLSSKECISWLLQRASTQTGETMCIDIV